MCVCVCACVPFHLNLTRNPPFPDMPKSELDRSKTKEWLSAWVELLASLAASHFATTWDMGNGKAKTRCGNSGVNTPSHGNLSPNSIHLTIPEFSCADILRLNKPPENLRTDLVKPNWHWHLACPPGWWARFPTASVCRKETKGRKTAICIKVLGRCMELAPNGTGTRPPTTTPCKQKGLPWWRNLSFWMAWYW